MNTLHEKPELSERTARPRGRAAVSFCVGRRLARVASATQGGFYLFAGLWPLLSMATFIAVTGPKTDLWVVRIVGALLAGSGAVFLFSAGKPRVSEEVASLAVTQAGVLAAADCFYATGGVISKVYFADAAVELSLISLWAVATLLRRRRTGLLSHVV